MPKLASTVSTSADRNASEVLELIADFQRCARATIVGLTKQSGASDLLGAWRNRKLKRTGKLLSPKGRFAFHGVGCRFEVAGRIIDVQFGPRSRHDGFDSWTLAQFAKSSFEWQHLSAADIDAGIERLTSTGVVIAPRLEPNPELVYLSEDLDSSQTPQSRKRSRR